MLFEHHSARGSGTGQPWWLTVTAYVVGSIAGGAARVPCSARPVRWRGRRRARTRSVAPLLLLVLASATGLLADIRVGA